MQSIGNGTVSPWSAYFLGNSLVSADLSFRNLECGNQNRSLKLCLVAQESNDVFFRFHFAFLQW